MTRAAVPRLYVVADFAYAGDVERWLELLGEVARASLGRPLAIQVRAGSALTATLAAKARERVSPAVPLLLNGDADLAKRLGYAGVHWPELSIPEVAGRNTFMKIAAVHSLAAVRRAEHAGADAVVFGAVFAPGSKTAIPVGLDALREIAASTSLPVLAIGGVTVERAEACVRAGAHGVAVVSRVLGAPSPGAAIERYIEALGDGPASADEPA